jgi:hypothetical protein
MLMLLRKLPLLFILVTGVCALFMVVNYDHQIRQDTDAYNAIITNRGHAIQSYLVLGEQLGQKQLWEDLNAKLEEARLAKQIDFYILQYRGHALWFGEKSGNLERIDIEFPLTTELFNSPSVSLRSIKIGDDYQLTLGLDRDLDGFLAEQAPRRYNVLFGQFIYIITLVGIFSLRDITLMVREIRRGKRGRVGKIQSRSAESELFLKGLTGYAQAVADLEAENVRLGRQVLPSLQKEIHSGRKPPYDFSCTMVRTDINHFSTIFNTYNVTEFMATINEFFDEVSRIVARYGGLIHEFVGDEVIYYFKDDEHANSFAIALSAIRDVNALAQRFHESTTASRGYPFTVKSSAAHGKVRFGPLVGGFTIAGAVLIETVRILSFISERDENTVYFNGINEQRLRGIIQSFDRMQVKMKGYQSEVRLHQYAAHLPLEHVLKTLNLKNVDQLFYYRSDRDLISIVSHLHLNAAAIDEATMLKAVRALREPYVARTEQSVSPHLRAWIEELLRKPDQAKILSAAVKLYINLVPRESFSDDDRNLLNQLLSVSDRRVVANTVEVVTHFATTASVGAASHVKKIRDDLRILANAIVLDGKEELTGEVMKRLKALLKSKKANELASGLYALGELAHIHRTHDAAYFSAHVDFQNLIASLDLFAQHTTTMVRRQALTAARKAANDQVISKIRHHVKDSGSELLAEELVRYLDSYNSFGNSSGSAPAA